MAISGPSGAWLGHLMPVMGHLVSASSGNYSGAAVGPSGASSGTAIGPSRTLLLHLVLLGWLTAQHA